MKRDFISGNLVAGTRRQRVARNIDSTFAPLLARHAELLGHDLFYSTPDHEYASRMQTSLTNVSGDAREVLLRQESSARYFQRPDRGSGNGGFFSNKLDSSATSLHGGGVYARVAKETGFTFGEIGFDTRTPGYESNDYAFQQRADYIFANSNFGLSWTTPKRWYHQLVALAGAQLIRNYEGDLTQTDIHIFRADDHAAVLAGARLLHRLPVGDRRQATPWRPRGSHRPRPFREHQHVHGFEARVRRKPRRELSVGRSRRQ